MEIVLTSESVVECLELYENGWTTPALARRYGVAVSTISRAIRGRTWAAVTGGIDRSRTGKLSEYRRTHIEARLEQGCRDLSRIATELGVSRQAVSKSVKVHDLRTSASAASNGE